MEAVEAENIALQQEQRKFIAKMQQSSNGKPNVLQQMLVSDSTDCSNIIAKHDGFW